MKLPKYPLEQLALIKQKRLEEAEKRLKEKKQILEKEKEKLKKLEDECQKVFDHKKEKLDQLREEMDKGTTSDKIQIARRYLEVVEDDLKKKKKKVKDQLKVVEAAEQQVEIAKKDFYKKVQDVEKLHLHKDEWKKQIEHELLQKEATESDEMGSIKHTSLKKERLAREEREKHKKTKQ